MARRGLETHFRRHKRGNNRYTPNKHDYLFFDTFSSSSFSIFLTTLSITGQDTVACPRFSQIDPGIISLSLSLSLSLSILTRARSSHAHTSIRRRVRGLPARKRVSDSRIRARNSWFRATRHESFLSFSARPRELTTRFESTRSRSKSSHLSGSIGTARRHTCSSSLETN